MFFVFLKKFWACAFRLPVRKYIVVSDKSSRNYSMLCAVHTLTYLKTVIFVKVG